MWKKEGVGALGAESGHTMFRTGQPFPEFHGGPSA
jgi:hypothetical protein